MGSPLWRLTVRSDFSSAHALRNYNGKCENIHGHNFAVEIVVQGSTLSEDTHLLIDFKILKGMLKEVLDLMDHSHLNDLPFFAERNPSSENIAAFIYTELNKRLVNGNARMYSVSVSEKAAQTATYLELD